MLKQEFQTLFKQKQLYFALLLFLFCLSASAAQIWLVRCRDGDALYMSAMDLSFTPVFFGGSILLVPFCASLSCSHMQVDEIRSGNIQFRLLRCGYAHYALGKLLSSSFAGFMVLGGAFALHTIIWHLVAGPYDPLSRPEIAVSFSPGTVYATYLQTKWAFACYLHAIIGFGITGSLWSIISLLCAMILNDSILSVTIPVVLYYLWKSDFTRYALGFSLPDFTGLYNDGVLWKNYWITFAIYIIMIIVSFLVYYFCLKRRMLDG